MDRSQPKDRKPTMIGRKLKSVVNWRGALKQKGVKQWRGVQGYSKWLSGF